MEIRKLTSGDGSRKYSFDLGGGRQMEASFFRIEGRERPNIACISTQLGCAVGCPFCAAGQSPFFRNLTKGEMLAEVAAILHDHPASQILSDGFEISFMGTGEPLANLPNLLGAIQEIHLLYPNITRVSVSTAGPARRIEALTQAMPVLPAVHLQLSLHATNDEVRRRLIPNAPDSIANLLQACRRYYEATGDQVFLNYVLLKGLNDSIDDARWLSQLERIPFYVKIAALNQTAGMPSEVIGASLDEIRTFSGWLRDYELPHKIFIGDGLDIQASCGQLAAAPREINA